PTYRAAPPIPCNETIVGHDVDALQIFAGTVLSARNGDRNQRRRQASEQQRPSTTCDFSFVADAHYLFLYGSSLVPLKPVKKATSQVAPPIKGDPCFRARRFDTL